MRSSPAHPWLTCGVSARAAGIARVPRAGWRGASPTRTPPPRGGRASRPGSRPPGAGDGLSDAALRSAANGGSGTGGRGSWPDGRPADEVIAPVVVGETPEGYLVAPEAHGDFGVAVRLVLHTAALAAGRLLDLAR